MLRRRLAMAGIPRSVLLVRQLRPHDRRREEHLRRQRPDGRDDPVQVHVSHRGHRGRRRQPDRPGEQAGPPHGLQGVRRRRPEVPEHEVAQSAGVEQAGGWVYFRFIRLISFVME